MTPEQMKREWTASTEQIERFCARTGLAPAVALDAVVDEVVQALGDDPRAEELFNYLRSDLVTDYVVGRSALVFANNDSWRRTMLSKDPRPAYFGFLRHWVAGIMATQFPEQLRKLPAGFKVGERAARVPA